MASENFPNHREDVESGNGDTKASLKALAEEISVHKVSSDKEKAESMAIPQLAADLPKGAAEEIQINWQAIVGSSLAAPFTASSGRQYVNIRGGIYYNSLPSQKKSWGKINELATTYFQVENAIVRAIGVGPAYTSGDQRNYSVFQVEEGKPESLFDRNGRELEKQGSIWKETGTHSIFWTSANGEIVPCDKEGMTEKAFLNNLVQNLKTINPDLHLNRGEFELYSLSIMVNGASYPMLSNFTIPLKESFVFEGVGIDEVSLSDFLNNVKGLVPKVKKAAELLQKIDGASAQERKKEAYLTDLNSLYTLAATENLLCVDRESLMNQVVWFFVETDEPDLNPAEVTGLAEALGQSHRAGFNEWDTLMRYYERSNNQVKAKEFAKKILSENFSGKALSVEDAAMVSESQKKAQEILGRP